MRRALLYVWALLPLCLGAESLKLSFTNASAYKDEEVFVWFRAADDYDLKFEGQSENLKLKKSYSLAELKKHPIVMKRYVSGRIYVSLGQPLQDNTAGDPGVHEGNNGYEVRHDFMELTYYPAPPDVADLTSMDQFAVQLELQLRKGGQDLSGLNAHAGWRGSTDVAVVAELGKIAKPERGNLQYGKAGNFIRVKGATTFPSIYHNEKTDPLSMAQYLKEIKKGQDSSKRKLVISGTAFDKRYQYDAKLDGTGNYVMTRTGGDASIPKEIKVPASYKAGAADADPVIYLHDAILMSNPWYSVDGGKVGPTQNDLSGAVARDLFAALNLGYVNSEHVVKAGETTNSSLVGKAVYALNTEQMRELKIGFSQVGKFYNQYADKVRGLSDSYGYAYSDWNENVGKVAVLLNADHNGQKADELNIKILGTKITNPKAVTPADAPSSEAPSPTRDAEYMKSVEGFLEN